MKRVLACGIVITALTVTILLGLDGTLALQALQPPQAVLAQDDPGVMETTSTATVEPTLTPEPTETLTLEPTETSIPTSTTTPTPTSVPATETARATRILSQASTATATRTRTPTRTATPSTSPTARKTATPTRTATPKRTATPRPSPTPLPSAYRPTCTLSSTLAVPNQRVTATCSGLRPAKRHYIRIRGRNTTLAELVTDSKGAGTAVFRVPVVTPRTWTVRVDDRLGVFADIFLTVPPSSLGLSVSTGPSGTNFPVNLAGFRANETVTIRWYATDGSSSTTLKTVAVSSKGMATVSLKVPANAGGGGHLVEAVGQTSRDRAVSVFSVTQNGQIRYLTKGTPGCNRIAFIFNIGVGYPLDTGVLDTLSAKDVPATMFVMGWWAEKNRSLLLRLASDGYVIGSHGYAQRELTPQSNAAVIQDIQKAKAAITNVLGSPPGPWFTPYAADIDNRVLNLIAGQGLTPVGWEISARDYDETAYESDVYARVVNNAYDGAIVEFHIDGPATRTSTGRALPRIIDTLRKRGYEFVTIPEMALRCGVEATRPQSFATALEGTILTAAPPTRPVRKSRNRARGRRR